VSHYAHGSGRADMTQVIALPADAIGAVYLELAETGRWEDFRWLAASQGLAGQRAVELWESLRARVVVPPPER